MVLRLTQARQKLIREEQRRKVPKSAIGMRDRADQFAYLYNRGLVSKQIVPIKPLTTINTCSYDPSEAGSKSITDASVTSVQQSYSSAVRYMLKEAKGISKKAHTLHNFMPKKVTPATIQIPLVVSGRRESNKQSAYELPSDIFEKIGGKSSRVSNEIVVDSPLRQGL
jgi:hypothetical protein